MNEYDFVASRFLATVKRPCQNWYLMKIYLQTLSVKAQARTCPTQRPPAASPPRPNKKGKDVCCAAAAAAAAAERGRGTAGRS